MSRTFRKNHRWLVSVNGEVYNPYSKDSSLNKYPKDDSYDVWGVSNPSFYSEEIVADGDCYTRLRMNSKDKASLHQKDRTRAKEALRKGIEDLGSGVENHWIPAFDPWDWD